MLRNVTRRAVVTVAALVTASTLGFTVGVSPAMADWNDPPISDAQCIMGLGQPINGQYTPYCEGGAFANTRLLSTGKGPDSPDFWGFGTCAEGATRNITTASGMKVTQRCGSDLEWVDAGFWG